MKIAIFGKILNLEYDDSTRLNHNPMRRRRKYCILRLWDKPIIRPRQSIGKNKVGEWFGKSDEELNIVATGNL